MSIPLLTLEDFLPHVGDTYHVQVNGQAIGLRLHEAIPLPTHGHVPARAPFSLGFLAAGEPPLGQGTYEMQRDGGDTLTIFIVALGPDPASKQMRYQAIFN